MLRSGPTVVGLGFLLSVTSVSSPANAQVLGQAPDDGVSLIRVVLSLFLCLLLAGAGAFALQYRMKGGVIGLRMNPSAAKRLVVAEKVQLSPQVGLGLVRLDQREFLVSFSAGTAPTIVEVTVDRPDETTSTVADDIA
jgi:hypothetical protein